MNKNKEIMEAIEKNHLWFISIVKPKYVHVIEGYYSLMIMEIHKNLSPKQIKNGEIYDRETSMLKATKIVNGIILENKTAISLDDIMDKVANHDISKNRLNQILHLLLSSSTVFSPMKNQYIHIENSSYYNPEDY